ncbi:TPA: Flp pilus assembly complex ATPase component TadA [Acinetobacter baumannii]|nr:Flp pilus assembly complex ATPase component TadA [Acinetobacter baumannii]
MVDSGIKTYPKLKILTGLKLADRIYDKEMHLRPIFIEIDKHKFSDIFLQVGKPILVQAGGTMWALGDRNLGENELLAMLNIMGGVSAQNMLNRGESLNLIFPLFDGDENNKTRDGDRVIKNFRVNISGRMHRGKVSPQIVMRAIPKDPPHFSDIGLDEDFVRKCCPAIGIVIVAGGTGHGKSTTLASIIRYILENRTPIIGNIITHEEPIEYTYDDIQSEHSIVIQSQVPENFKSFHDANREAMRRKPAGLLVGELRDAETISSALELALTGHPAFATIHASSVSLIFQRIITRFPNAEKRIRSDLLACCKMLVAQKLIFDKKGERFAVREFLYITEKFRNSIMHLQTTQEVEKAVREYMDTHGSEEPNAIASFTFAKKGRMLLEQGIIDEEALATLAEQQTDEEEEAIVASLAS